MKTDKFLVDFLNIGMDNELNAIPEAAEEKFGSCKHHYNETVEKAQELGYRIQETH